MFGGIGKNSYTRSCEAYDIVENFWTMMESKLPTESNRNNAVTHRSLIYITGLRLVDVVEFNPKTRSTRNLSQTWFATLNYEMDKGILAIGDSLLVLNADGRVVEINLDGEGVQQFQGPKFPDSHNFQSHVVRLGSQMYYMIQNSPIVYCLDIEKRRTEVFSEIILN